MIGTSANTRTRETNLAKAERLRLIARIELLLYRFMTVEIQTLTHFGHRKKERVTRNISIDMEQVKFLPLLIICVQTAKGLIWNSNPTSVPACVDNTISLNWVYTLQSGEILQVTSWTKSDGAGGFISLADDFGGFTPATGYVGRLIRIGNAGIQISNAASSDIGTYTVVVTLISGSTYRMSTTVRVHEIANVSCKPTCDSSWKCQIPQACPVQNYIDAVWTVEGVKHPNVFQCSPNNYNKPYNVCPEGDAVTSCYSGPSLCRNEIKCIGCKLELGLGLGLGLGIQCVITGIVVVIFICTDYKHAYFLGLVYGVGEGSTFQLGWIIIASLISTGTISCKLELGLGLGLGSGMPCVITIIIAVIFVFKGTPKRVELGKGILTGLLFASVIGIIVVYLMYHKLKRELTSINHEDNPPKQDDKKSKTKNPGPTAVHTRTENKLELNTNSKQTNHRQQPVPPVNTGFEDTPTFRRLPQTPQNGEIKDRSLPGISATIDDKRDLATETPQPNKLPPIPLKQETVQEENASEKHKKKRTKKKKKDQMNVETPEEENGETDLRDN